MTKPSRYIIGVDLGTTNTAVCFVDTQSATPEVRVFEITQLIGAGEVAVRNQLPSFVYLAGSHEAAQWTLPWDSDREFAVGVFARTQGARVPNHLVASAKSWLCHGGVDREAAILPWGVEGDNKISPMEAQARILGHVREAWDDAHPQARMADQEVVLTVPASFDEAARELTSRAAEMAGVSRVVLLEEPQAAFYAWVDTHAANLRAQDLQPKDQLLVFDVGGGTTDFTLISVGKDGESFERTAVGDHLLLGGDNIDMTLAKQVEERLLTSSKDNKKLDLVQWHGLVHACRSAKEVLLGDTQREAAVVTVPGRGRKVIGGTRKGKVTRAELDQLVEEGFFPHVPRGALPSRKRGGFQEFGLPYATDAAISRHLAAFLQKHQVQRVDAVLFNGGAMTPDSLRSRVIALIGSWQSQPPRELHTAQPELAVAKGAAYYGLVRRGLGVRIRGGTPRAFYVGVEDADANKKMAICIAPKGLEEGSEFELDRLFDLVTNRPVGFRLYSSTSGKDQPGALVDPGDGDADATADGSDLLQLPPIVTVLRASSGRRVRSQVEVKLRIRITELGALELWCIESSPPDMQEPGRWRLTFDMRAGGAVSAQGAVADRLLEGLNSGLCKCFKLRSPPHWRGS